MHPCNNFGMWTVNKKSEQCVTLHIDFLVMSDDYLSIRTKCVAPLLLGDVKNFLIPPRMNGSLHFYKVTFERDHGKVAYV